MAAIRCVILVTLVGSLGLAQSGGTRSKAAAPDDPALKALVAHLAKHDIKLEHDKDGWWVVTEPKEGAGIKVHFRTFPASFDDKAMQEDLMTINLGYMLNREARLAMSYPGKTVTGGRLEGFFKEYRPAEAKK